MDEEEEQAKIEINTLFEYFAVFLDDDNRCGADEQAPPTSTPPTANILGLLSTRYTVRDDDDLLPAMCRYFFVHILSYRHFSGFKRCL